jgi:uncharacterized membrane-anchored protein YhcB (DUF1043 family)
METEQAAATPEVQSEAIAPEAEAVEQPTEAVEEAPAPITQERDKRVFRQLARREAELRAKERELKKLASQVDEYRPSVDSYSELQNLAKSNPTKVLDQLGISYEDLTQAVINGGEPTREMQLAEQNKMLAQRLEKLESQISERVKAEESKKYETAYSGFIDEIKEFVDNDAEAFPLVTARAAWPLVAQHMQAHYDRTQEILDYSTAVSLIEEHLNSDLQAYLSHEKIRERFLAGKEKEPEAIAEPAKQDQTPAPKTLSSINSVTPQDDGQLLSRDESLARAAAVLKGAL